MATEGQHFTINYAEAATLTITLAGSGSIAGWTMTFKAGSKTFSGSASISKTVGSGITITDAANRVLTVALATGDTDITPGTYQWSLVRTNAGSETQLAKGNMRIRPTAHQLS